jgi:predicted HTH domain antitoxin
MKMELEIDLPQEVVAQLPATDLGRLCREEIVLHLHSQRKLTAGDGARVLGLTRLQFLDLLNRRGTGLLVDLDAEDFRQIDELTNRHPSGAN